MCISLCACLCVVDNCTLLLPYVGKPQRGVGGMKFSRGRGNSSWWWVETAVVATGVAVRYYFVRHVLLCVAGACRIVWHSAACRLIVSSLMCGAELLFCSCGSCLVTMQRLPTDFATVNVGRGYCCDLAVNMPATMILLSLEHANARFTSMSGS